MYDLRATRHGTPYATTRRDVDAKTRYAKSGIASKEVTPAITLPTLLDQACASAGNAPALRTERPTPARPAKKGDPAPKSLPVDQWKTWTYNEYLAEIKVAARAFMSFGLKKHDAVTIYGFNAPEWHMAELSAIYCGGIAAGIYPSDTPEQVTFKANHSGSVVAVCESVKQLKVFIDSKRDGRLPKLKAVVVWTDDSWGVGKQVIPDDTAGLNVVFWKDLGKYAASVSESKLQSRTKSISPGNVCAYIYTSGTTGSPKAVMITHDNIVYEAKVAVHLLPQMGASNPECVLSYLPLSHVAGMMVDIVCPVVMTACRPSYCTVYVGVLLTLKSSLVSHSNTNQQILCKILRSQTRYDRRSSSSCSSFHVLGCTSCVGKDLGEDEIHGGKESFDRTQAQARPLGQETRTRASDQLSTRWFGIQGIRISDREEVDSRHGEKKTRSRSMQVRLHGCCSDYHRDIILLWCSRYSDQRGVRSL